MRIELQAGGLATVIAAQNATVAEFSELRRENKWLKEKVEVLWKVSTFLAQWATKT